MLRKLPSLLLCLPVAALAQAQDVQVEVGDRAFVRQAQKPDEAMQSSVFLPDNLQPQGLLNTPLVRPTDSSQLSNEKGIRAVPQLTTDDGTDPLMQLTQEERQVLLEAVSGTDICERELNVAAIRKLCDNRIETRSADFERPPVNVLSPEERLLGGSLDSWRTATLERVIARLAGNSASARDFNDQAIASIALSPAPNVSGPPDDVGKQEGFQLSPETRALIEAIVEQFPSTPGGRP